MADHTITRSGRIHSVSTLAEHYILESQGAVHTNDANGSTKNN